MNIIPPEAIHFLVTIMASLWSLSLNLFLVGLGLNWSFAAVYRLVRLNRILRRQRVKNSGLVQ